MDGVHCSDVHVWVLLGYHQLNHLLGVFYLRGWLRIFIHPQIRFNALVLQSHHHATHSYGFVSRALLFSVCWTIFGPESMYSCISVFFKHLSYSGRLEPWV